MSDFLHEQMARKMFEDYASYESPIERICREVMADRVEQEENALVYRVSVEVGYNINKEELIKALQYDRNQYQKGFEDCARSMRLEQTEWIPVSEMLPKYNTPVLLALKQIGKERAIVIGERRTRKNGWYFVDIAAYDTEHEVIAWMPLPEPYKAESEDICG